MRQLGEGVEPEDAVFEVIEMESEHSQLKIRWDDKEEKPAVVGEKVLAAKLTEQSWRLD